MPITYELVVFGTKDTTCEIVSYLHESVKKVSLIVTIETGVTKSNQISGYKDVVPLAEQLDIPVYQAASYTLDDKETKEFFDVNTFGIGISMGWQRLIPGDILDKFSSGIFGFHGSCGYLPYGRGRSPLNWSIINGDTRFILNLFQYDENADSPNVFENQMFEITPFDTIRTLQYKNLLCAKSLLNHLLEKYEKGEIQIRKNSRDRDSWYPTRRPADGKIDFSGKTRDIYNLIRGVTRPFPGAFAECEGEKVIIWRAVPFDQIMDFSMYRPGEIIANFDECPIVRTLDASLLILEYESKNRLMAGRLLV